MIRSNVAIRTRTPELIDFFYPKYMRLKEYSPFLDCGVIFEGDSKYLQSFRDNNIPYIYVKGTPEFDLTIPENLLNFVYEKWDKKPPKGLTDYFNSFDKVNDELEDLAKQIWVTGKCSHEETSETRMNNLYTSFARGSTYDLIKEYIELSNDVDPEKLFYSIQWFLKQSNNPNNIKSVYIKKNAVAFKESRGMNIEPALLAYLYSSADNMELKLLNLFDKITEIKR